MSVMAIHRFIANYPTANCLRCLTDVLYTPLVLADTPARPST